MATAIGIDGILTVMGKPDTVHAFFSSVSANLEATWGARFPALMAELYQGRLANARAGVALAELETARREMATLPASAVVWDAADRSIPVPFGFGSHAPTLAQAFTTDTGADLIGVLAEVLEWARDEGTGDVEIMTVPEAG